MSYTETIGSRSYRFADLKTLLAKASPLRSGDQLAVLEVCAPHALKLPMIPGALRRGRLTQAQLGFSQVRDRLRRAAPLAGAPRTA